LITSGKDHTPLDDLKRFFDILDMTEESDSGCVFHPVHISSCRVMLMDELNGILNRLKAHADMTSAEWNQALAE
jgi:hypothetical protein